MQGAGGLGALLALLISVARPPASSAGSIRPGRRGPTSTSCAQRQRWWGRSPGRWGWWRWSPAARDSVRQVARRHRPSPPGRARRPHRALPASRHPRGADHRSQLHDRLIEGPGALARARHERRRFPRAVARSRRAVRRGWNARRSHARHVGVHRRGRPLVGEARHRAGGVAADAGQLAAASSGSRGSTPPCRAPPPAPAGAGSRRGDSSPALPTLPNRPRASAPPASRPSGYCSQEPCRSTPPPGTPGSAAA